MKREEKKVLGFNASAHFLIHLLEGVLPPLIPLLIVQFNTDYFHMGIVVTIFSYAFGFGALPSGYVADRVNPYGLILIFLFGSGLLSVAVLPVQSLFGYGVIMGFIGLFCCTYHPAANTLISHVHKEKGKAFAVNGIAGSLGVAIVPVLSAWIASAMGWKAPHMAFGIFGIIVGCYGLLLPKDSYSFPNKDDLEASLKKDQTKVPVLNLIVFYCSAACCGSIYKGIMTFLPAYMGQEVRLGFVELDTVAIGGTVATLALLSGTVGQYISGRLSDRTKPERIYFAGTFLGALCVFVMAMTSGFLLVIFSMLFAFFYFSSQPAQNYIISNYLPKHRLGLGFGIHFFVAFGVGSTAAAISGYLADKFGLSSVFYTMGGIFLLASLFAGFLLFRAETANSSEALETG
ncbi:MAG: MFS transporter [Deltaproteobacteria bacterium]|nr:MFS transporter [Deltaproteobacteria bacterium]